MARRATYRPPAELTRHHPGYTALMVLRVLKVIRRGPFLRKADAIPSARSIAWLDSSDPESSYNCDMQMSCDTLSDQTQAAWWLI